MKHYKKIIVAMAVTGFALTIASQPASASWNGFRLTKSEQQIYRSVGVDYGCSVPAKRGLELRVTSKQAVLRARQLKKSKARFGGKRITAVRRVPESQSLVNYMAAWLAVETTRTYPGGFGAKLSVSSAQLPLKKNRCRPVQITLIGWPGHDISPAELDWANDLVRSYPETVSLTTFQTDSEPTMPLAD